MAERCDDIVSRCRLRLAEFAVAVLGLDPYDWQINTYEDINDYRRTAVVAANGSGKTVSLVGPVVLWWLYCFPRGRVVLTSGSWRQLKTQLWPAIRAYQSHPAFRGWKWNQMEILTPEGGFTSIFSTNDEQKAEGYHATAATPVLYIVDEAKGVQDGIFEAADRCTVTRYLYLSSPGSAMGKHYRCFHDEAKNWRRTRVTSYMCPHIRPETYGESHPLYRSMHLAEWTEGEDMLVITPEQLRHAIDHPPAFKAGGQWAALDFAAGRDENAIAVREGTLVRLDQVFRQSSTVQARRRMANRLKELGIEAHNAWGDSDGLGLPIVQQMAEPVESGGDGYRIKEFRGGLPGEDPEHYLNTISEAWILGARDIVNGKIRIDELDPVTFRQMTTRQMEWDQKGRLRVMSKEDMRGKGLHSPDRADVIFMAIWAGRSSRGIWTEETDVYTPPDTEGWYHDSWTEGPVSCEI
ncbi:hypothetical protein [uncultured Akkermansia sp.]|uniref:hypothetical protein n=1 Tax=uncultured Akkermansia sp. TaxID=512294 RepID=UPI00260507BF|nr:hypothetical protein [uncultured Akkermansia sp.]